ncbi:MAG TPA: hypothetical protein DF637_04755 [Rikenellaceae bacterium]|nr:hypothetical protein [Rikenellaceae bacterium]
MKIYRFLIIVAIALLTTNSCKTDVELQTGEIKVIDLAGAVGGGKIVNISEVADDIKYVALETTDSSLIGSKAVVQIVNGLIYVTSRGVNIRDVKVFDLNGKYIFTFNKAGRGPKEYSPLSQFEIDPVTGGFNVYGLFPNEKALKEYNKDGDYIRTVKIPVIEIGSLEAPKKINHNCYISSVGKLCRENVKVHGVVFDSVSNILFEIPLSKAPDYMPKEFVQTMMGENGPVTGDKAYNTWSPTVYIVKTEARLINSANDSIFTLDQNLNYYPSFIINYGGFINKSFDRKNITLTKGDHISLDPQYYIETTRLIILNFFMRDYAHEPYNEYVQANNRVITVPKANCYGIYDKQTGFFNLMNQSVKGKLGFREDIKNGPPFIPAHISKDDLASALFSAVQIIEHAEVYDVKGELKEIVSKLKDTDNPVVAIAKFK